MEISTAKERIKKPFVLFSKEDLKKLIVPMMIEQTLALTVGMFDTIMVASAGETAVSGVSLVETINILIINLFAALATGGAIVVSQYLGKQERENSRNAARHLVVATLGFSLCITVVCLLLNRRLLSLFFGNIEPEVMSSSRTYFYVTALSYPFIALYNASAALFRGMGNSKIAMQNSFVMNLLNISGNALFIFVFKWGVFGAAAATTISRIVAAFVMLYMLRNTQLEVYVRSYSLKNISFSMIKRILRIGIPNGIEGSMFQIGKIIMTGLVASMGTTTLAAHAVGNSLTGVEVILGAAMGLALTTVVSRCVGAGEYEQADTYIKYLLKRAFLYMAILNSAIILLLNPILGMYKISGEAYQLALKILLLHGVGAMAIWPFSFSLPNAFRAAGDVKFPMSISIFSMWVFRVGGGYLLANVFHVGVLSIWIAMEIDWVFRTVLYVWRWKSGKWKNKKVV